MKTGYNIRTWRMRLVCPEPLWLDRTEEYFQNVVEFYYHLLRQHEELWNSSLFDIQRSLELLTLAGRDGRQPTNPLPMGKVPVYLRRAAINKASATVKSTQELQSGFPEKLEAKVTFFKGMYSDLTDRSICLKLWNGEKWMPLSPRWSANVTHPGKGGQALPAEYPGETGEQRRPHCQRTNGRRHEPVQCPLYKHRHLRSVLHSG